MHWVDVAGPPGAGKSTLCDPLWGPHDIHWRDSPPPPMAWHDFCNEISRLFWLIRKHPTVDAAVRMNRRSIRKMSVVARMEQTEDVGPYPYIQTALAQRGLGFGWRMADMGIHMEELRQYFRRMPVSIGVAVCTAPQDIIEGRNHERTKHKATAHENRDFMVPLMLPAIDIMKEELEQRGVPVIDIDTTRDPDESRSQLLDFASREPFDPEAGGPGSEVEVFSPPAWW